ncbi:MAG: tRNA (adenosine(37)-N6)-threonylcarbamoyltransferase complex transferase subunit TsaD, partial [Candidatus Lambdaproteobacteria bacterium]|nr:tRNA (adenosine(37)-N6)-threonylcarbamoyltransferase complex transferase subunit TsaD [Candidatus Lambdaproteobacteria bacterium]
DKVAKLFGHPMPGGPVVDRLAAEHAPGPYDFPRPMLADPGLDFSFSGLKTALRYFRRDHPQAPEGPVLSAFFAGVVEVLVTKTLRAAASRGVDAVSVSGGLAASRCLRAAFERVCAERGLRLFYPPPQLCTDNAAMVACLAAHRYEAGLVDDLLLDGFPNLVE